MTLRGVFLFVVSVHPILTVPAACALDIHNVQTVTLDFPPSAYVMLQRPGDDAPLMDDFGLIGFAGVHNCEYRIGFCSVCC